MSEMLRKFPYSTCLCLTSKWLSIDWRIAFLGLIIPSKNNNVVTQSTTICGTLLCAIGCRVSCKDASQSYWDKLLRKCVKCSDVCGQHPQQCSNICQGSMLFVIDNLIVVLYKSKLIVNLKTLIIGGQLLGSYL
uniref:TACI cysteine-rich domain-containing protein n=1 Tax=Callorhinchus milii TaxID=7868 RepID=A0A4W3H729_CALMI